jgi:cyclase
MRLDRVAEDIFIFASDLYAQVTTTVLFTAKGAIVVDTLPFPSESRAVASFIENKLGPDSVRYVINTHHHADHVFGTCFFEGAEVISQDLCREILATSGQARLDRAKAETPALAEVTLCLPHITFGEEMSLHLGHRHLLLLHTPGHTADSISIFIEDEKVLIAGDTVMPVPYIVGGDGAQLQASLRRVQSLAPSFIIQGHGDVLLRGEIEETLESSIAYLETITQRVRELVERGEPAKKLRAIDIESCGKSRIPLNGLVSRLHLDNLLALYKTFSQNEPGPAR